MNQAFYAHMNNKTKIKKKKKKREGMLSSLRQQEKHKVRGGFAHNLCWS
jgi:hypothetical protein